MQNKAYIGPAVAARAQHTMTYCHGIDAADGLELSSTQKSTCHCGVIKKLFRGSLANCSVWLFGVLRNASRNPVVLMTLECSVSPRVRISQSKSETK